MLLVLETARVEVAVLLNELAYSKYEASKSADVDESIIIKQRNLAITFSLIEKIIKLISHASEIEGICGFNFYHAIHTTFLSMLPSILLETGVV